jgi:cell wall-associated NlpC family hydrolase
LTNFSKLVALSFAITLYLGTGSAEVNGQTRERVVRTTSSSQPTNAPAVSTAPTQTVRPTSSSRPVLTNDIRVVRNDPAWEPAVAKTASVNATNAVAILAAGRSAFAAGTTSRIDNAVKSKYGIRYRLGTSGPDSYDCSGFVWSVFQDAGIRFTRQSARSLWLNSTPVYGDDRFKFGTLVFLNGLGHVGIVVDEKGFYHASTSKGITYSPFKGYWEKRIVGFKMLAIGEGLETAN